MRDFLVLTGLLVVAFCVTVVLGAGMNEWQLASHPVDPTADCAVPRTHYASSRLGQSTQAPVRSEDSPAPRR